AKFSRLGTLFVLGNLLPGFSRLGVVSRVSDAIQTRLSTPATGDKIQRTIPSDLERADIQRFAMHERFEIACVTGAVRLEVNGKNPAIRPIERVQSFLIFFREFAFRAELHAGR